MANPPNGRECYEAKPEPGDDFSRQHPQSTRGKPVCRVGNADRAPEERFDEREPVSLTGRYVHSNQQFYLFINHAGPHIEMLMAMVGNGPADSTEPSDKTRTRDRIFRFGGDVDPQNPDLYYLYFRKEGGATDDKSLTCGTMGVVHASKFGVQLALDLSGVEAQAGDEYLKAKLNRLEYFANSLASRYDESPNLFENHLCKSSIPASVRTDNWFPVTQKQKDAAGKFILAARVAVDLSNYLVVTKGGTLLSYEDLVRAFYNPEGLEPPKGDEHIRQRRVNVVTALNELIANARGDALQAPVRDGGIDDHHLDLFWSATRATLDDTKIWVDDHIRSLMTHTRAIMDFKLHKMAIAPQIDQIRDGLGIMDEGPYDYEAEINVFLYEGSSKQKEAIADHFEKSLKLAPGKAKDLAGKVFGVLNFGGMTGTLHVRRGDPQPYLADYVIALHGIKIGKSVGGEVSVMSSKGSATSVYGPVWRPEHIDGRAKIVDLGASAIGGVGKSVSLTGLNCYGSGVSKPNGHLTLNFTGLSDLVGTWGLGIGMSRFWGRIGHIRDSGGDVSYIEFPPYEVESKLRYSASGDTLHFPINGARLTHAGRGLLQIFAATELAVLGREGVQLKIEGYTDQPDTEIRNLLLSRNRAMSVYNYLKNILEDDLALPELKDVPSEAEELKKHASVTKQGLEYEVVNPSRGRLLVLGWGEPKKKEKKKGEQEGYDASLRRVDVALNGELRVVLRRGSDDGIF